MRVFRWGDDLAVQLPQELVDRLGLKEGDELNVVAAKGGTAEANRRRRTATRSRSHRRAQLGAARGHQVQSRRGQ